MTLGGLLFGTIADYSGRRNLIPISMVIIFSAFLGLSFSQTYFLISFFIFMLGIGLAGSHLVLRVYLIECVPANRRGICLVLIDLLWSIGYVVSLSLSWILIPSIIKVLSKDFRPNSWRVLVGLGSAPCLIIAYLSNLLPPSPRYLLYRRRPQQALIVFQQMFAINNSQHINNFPSCNLNNCVRSDEDDVDARYFFQILREFIFKTWKKIKLIYSKNFIKCTLLFIFLRLFLFPGLIQITQWTAYLSDETNYASSSNTTCSIDLRDIGLQFLNYCHEVNHVHFKHSLILSSSFILVISGLIGGISILVVIFGYHQDAKTIWSILFLSSFAIIHTTTSIKLLEHYPTSVRGTIWGFTLVLPYITSFLISFFAVIPCWMVIYVMLGLLIGAVLAVLPIPDLTNSPMKE
ncbi:Similar to SV2B: Synaptic vesicle glycoprotein 2B (Homo sapiens), partial [Cotesia congregata]